MRKTKFGALTYCGLAISAFVVADIAHEILGHGGACLASGGEITVLSSSLFRCSPPQAIVDAAGPIASFAVAATAAIGLKMPVETGYRRSFLAFLFAIAGFWFAGQLMVTAISNTDDWSFVLRALATRDSWPFWRLVMGIVGVILYVIILRRVGPEIPTGRPLIAAYVAVGITACVSAAFYSSDLLASLWQAALESFGASIGLLYLALRPVRSKAIPVHL